MMRIQCPKTCGFCDGATLPPPTTTTKLVTTTKPKTIMLKPSVCVDQHAKCGQLKRYCNHKVNAERVRPVCPVTCGVCTPKPVTTAATTQPAVTANVSGTCTDRTPKFCKAQKKICKVQKYQKTMKYKCAQTCGFCSAAPKPTQIPTPAAKFGAWSQWSKCSARKTKYQKRKCLEPPCTKRQLYNIQKMLKIVTKMNLPHFIIK